MRPACDGAAGMGWRLEGAFREESEQAAKGQFRSNLLCLLRSLDLIPRAAGATGGLGAGE